MLGLLQSFRRRLSEAFAEPAGPDPAIRPEQLGTLRHLAGAVLADPDDRRAARQFRDALAVTLDSEGPAAVVLPDGSVVAVAGDMFRLALAVPVDRVVDLGGGESFPPRE